MGPEEFDIAECRVSGNLIEDKPLLILKIKEQDSTRQAAGSASLSCASWRPGKTKSVSFLQNKPVVQRPVKPLRLISRQRGSTASGVIGIQPQ